ncbi:hypothetical protein DPMN_145919 [Dreissena polymorpha]|uniref:Sushi domain-containing protein n=2 Tax=Dreissena polymorpha TaxID=45954 RepID=A0A9D4J1M3_DREPO|nr:hypothetical protein DPMN_145919 [Dreissena polymorpha]
MWGQLIIALACASKVLAQDCVIPSGSQFSKATYRPYDFGRKTFYNAGERLIVGTKIRVVCNKDRQGDAVLKVSNHVCSAGNWSQPLPVCQEYKRCRAPPRVENTTASERITPYIIFPHQTVVTYKCNAYFDKRGMTSTVTCVDGEWTSADVICVNSTTVRSEIKETIETTTKNGIPSAFCEAPDIDFSITWVFNNMTKMDDISGTRHLDGTVLTVVDPRCSHRGTGNYTCHEGQWVANAHCNPDRCVYDRTRYVFKPNITADGLDRTTEYVNSGTFVHVECAAPNGIPGYDSTCQDLRWDPALPNCDGGNQQISNKQETRIIASVVPSVLLLGAVIALAVYCSKLRRKQTQNLTDKNYFTTTEVLTDKCNYEILDKYTVTEQARGTNR